MDDGAVPRRPALVPEVQLPPSPDFCMHGDDLFDQSCAGPWHTDDQYWRRILAAEFGRLRNPFACAAGNYAVGLKGKRSRIKRSGAAAHGVSSIEMLHGQAVVAKVLRS